MTDIIKVPAGSDKMAHETATSFYEDKKKANVFSSSYSTNEVSLQEDVVETEISTETLEGFEKYRNHFSGSKVLGESKTDWIKDVVKELGNEKPKVKYNKDHEESLRLKDNEGVSKKADAHTTATKAARSIKGKGYGSTDVSDEEETDKTSSKNKEFNVSSALLKAFGMNPLNVPKGGQKLKVQGKDTVDTGTAEPKPTNVNKEPAKVASPDDLAIKIHGMLHGATRSIFSIQHIQAALAKGMTGNTIINMSRSASGRKQLRSIKEEIELNESRADPLGKWVSHNNGKNAKTFKTRDGAKAHADRNSGHQVSSAEFFQDKFSVKKEEIELDEAAYRSTFQHPVHGTVTIKNGETKDSATARMDAAKAAKSAKAKSVSSLRAPKELSHDELGDVDKAQKNSAHAGLGGSFDHHITDPKHTTISVDGKQAAAAHCHGRFAYKVEDDLGLDQDTDEAHKFTMYRHPVTKKMHVIYGHAKSTNSGGSKTHSYDDFVKGRSVSEEVALDEGYNSDARSKLVCSTCNTKGSVKKDSAGSHKCTECGTKATYNELNKAGVFKYYKDTVKECISDNWDVEIIKENNVHKFIIRDEQDILAEGISPTYDGALRSSLRKSDELVKYINESLEVMLEEKLHEEGKIDRVKNIIKSLTK